MVDDYTWSDAKEGATHLHASNSDDQNMPVKPAVRGDPVKESALPFLEARGRGVEITPGTSVSLPPATVFFPRPSSPSEDVVQPAPKLEGTANGERTPSHDAGQSFVPHQVLPKSLKCCVKLQVSH